MPDLTLAEYCQFLTRVYGASAPSYHVVRAAVAEGRVPAHKVGNQWRVSPDNLERARMGLRLPAKGRVA